MNTDTTKPTPLLTGNEMNNIASKLFTSITMISIPSPLVKFMIADCFKDTVIILCKHEVSGEQLGASMQFRVAENRILYTADNGMEIVVGYKYKNPDSIKFRYIRSRLPERG